MTDLGDDVVGDGEECAAALAAVDVSVHVVELERTSTGTSGVRVDGEAIGRLSDGVHGSRGGGVLLRGGGCCHPFFGGAKPLINHLR